MKILAIFVNIVSILVLTSILIILNQSISTIFVYDITLIACEVLSYAIGKFFGKEDK